MNSETQLNDDTDQVTKSTEPNPPGSGFNISVSGFVEQLSPMKRAKRSNQEYFDGVIQEHNEYHRFVCFSPAKKKLFQEAKVSKKPILCSPIKKTPSNRKNITSEFIVSDNCDVSKTEVNFDQADFVDEVQVDVVNVDVLSTLNDRSIVSLELYVNPDAQEVMVLLPYKSEPIAKKEVKGNDNTGSIKLVLWGDKIQDVPTSGVYKVTNAVLRKFFGTTYVTTNTGTQICTSDMSIEPDRKELVGLENQKFKFPPENVHELRVLFFCTKCSKNKENISKIDLVFKCVTCKSTKMQSKARKTIETKLDFLEANDKIVTVSLFGPQTELYYKRQGKSIPTEEEIIIDFLQDTNTQITCDNRNVCIGFQ